MFNQSVASGIFPSILKTSKIISTFKKGSKLEFSYCRLVSLFSDNYKILERLTYKTYDLHSASHTLIHLTHKTKYEVEKENYTCAIFEDFQNAFDTVDHHILLNKLEYHGVTGIPINWFVSYLINRKQFVSLNGFQSNLVDVKCSVPQGSIMGPLLFLIYINDLHLAIKYSEVHHFADGTF